jgi:hypothetical protein
LLSILLIIKINIINQNISHRNLHESNRQHPAQRKEIIIIDLSNRKLADIIKILPEASNLIASCAPQSALVLTDVNNAIYNQEVANAMKDFVKGNTPYIKDSAIIGADGIRMVLLNTVSFLSIREIISLSEKQEAPDWLAAHK